MSLWASWILVPAVLTALFAGCGIALERALRTTLPGTLVPAAGLSVVIVVAGLLVLSDATAELAAPAVAVIAVAGLALGRPWRDPRLAGARWPLLAAAGGFAIVAWPSLMTGQGLFTGYVKLDDSATWMALSDQAFTHGRDLSQAGLGSYAETLRVWMGGDYPLGAFMALGAGSRLTGADAIAVYEPLLAMLVAVLVLGISACVRPLVRAAWPAAGCGLIGVQASLFLGYVQWGGLKEATLLALLPLLGWAAASGSLGVLCVGSGAAVGVYSVNGMAWAGPALLVGLVVAAAAARPLTARHVRLAGAAAVLLSVCALPAITTAGFLKMTTSGGGAPITSSTELGNLIKPLSLLEGFGLWPVGDFRVDPDPRWLAVLLTLAGIAAAGGALALCVRRRAWPLVLFVVVTLTGSGAAVKVGSPWVDAKALAILAPAILAASAALAAAGLAERRRSLRALGAAGAIALAAGAAWSTIAIARDVQVAPRERLAELRDVADRIGSTGPTLLLDFEIYGDRHLLRHAAVEGATDLRTRQVPKTDGQLFASLSSAEVDLVRTSDLWAYRTIVRRRTPVGSRPPAAFRLIFRGSYWEAWQRPADAPAPLARLPLGSELAPTAIPDCNAVRSLSRTPQARTLAAVARVAPLMIDLATGELPDAWHTPGGVQPIVDGTGRIPVQLSGAGRWRVWIGGTVFGRLDVAIDGHALGHVRHELSHSGQWLRFGTAQLSAGPHTVTLEYARGGLLRAGRQAAARQSAIGPLALTPVRGEDDPAVERIAASRYRRLCDGRAYDWIEAGQ